MIEVTKLKIRSPCIGLMYPFEAGRTRCQVHGVREAYTDNGREPTGLDVVDWAKKVEKLGAGEILLTSIDMDGTKKGFDINLNKAVSEVVSIPVICSGGAGKNNDVLNLLSSSKIDAVAVASLLHYELSTISDLKFEIYKIAIKVRV